MTVAAWLRVLFPSSSYVVKRIVKKRRAEAFEVCQLQDPIKYQMHVCPLHNPHKAAIQLYSSLHRVSSPAHTVCENLGLLISMSPEKWPQLLTSLFSAIHVFVTKIFSFPQLLMHLVKFSFFAEARLAIIYW